MERHTFTVNFWASPSKARKTGLMPIYVTIRMNGERATFTTGKYIHPNDWDEVKQRARGYIRLRPGHQQPSTPVEEQDLQQGT